MLIGSGRDLATSKTNLKCRLSSPLLGPLHFDLFNSCVPPSSIPTINTMKLAVVASLIAGASAFLPSAEKSSSSALSAVKKAPVKKAPVKKAVAKKGAAPAFATEIGVQAPLDFWDPLGYLNGASQEEFDKLRYLEIKHGRTFHAQL